MQELLNSVEKEISKRNISEQEVADALKDLKQFTNRRIVSGYASVSIVDREGQRISLPALKQAVKQFMEDPHYRNQNIFHSDITVGRILPKWTNPDTGEVYETKVDDKGFFVVAEVRDDVEIADKVWAEIEKGNIRSFSIAGSSKAKKDVYESGKAFEDVTRLEIYENTFCLPDSEKVWTKKGLLSIKDITTKDYVFTHNGRWKKVAKVMSRAVSENLVRIQTELGHLVATKNHPVRALLYEGKHKGTHYGWKPIGEISIGDLISSHESNKKCKACGSPLFSGSHKFHNSTDFCNNKCRFSIPGNRKGRTKEVDAGTLSASNKMKQNWKNDREHYHIITDSERKMGYKAKKKTLSSKEFKRKRSEIQTKLWKDPEYKKKQSKALHTRRKELGTYKKLGLHMKKLWKDPKFAQKMFRKFRKRPNLIETRFDKFLKKSFPKEWKYVGDGKFWIEGKNPDFINVNGQKKIIELDGIYWHKNKDSKKRIKHFAKYGYETLIITDKEFDKDQKKCEKKVKEFCGNKLSKVIGIEKISFSGTVYNLEVEEDNSYTTEFAVVHNCETGVNPMAKFDILWNPEKVKV